jgi:hypothetical protein
MNWSRLGNDALGWCAGDMLPRLSMVHSTKGGMFMDCPACGARDLSPFHALSSIPVNSCVLLEDQSAARDFPRGDLRLSVCRRCGFITNTAFDPALTSYSSDYEETQGFSPRFRQYISELARHWVARYGLDGRTVIELGCGKGEFMEEMLDAGVGHAIGVDPALRLDRVPPAARARGTWVPGRFPNDFPELDAAAVICRHTLEHIAPVGGWMRSVRAAIGRREDTVVLFEVPDVLPILKRGAFWDLYYEHCSYFCSDSLEALFRQCGFEPLDIYRTFDDQYLVIEARPSTTSRRPDFDRQPLSVSASASFATSYDQLVKSWRSRLRRDSSAGGPTVIWGASSKAVGFLTALGPDAVHIAAAVDINPHKQGSYLPGTGHLIAPPKQLIDMAPALVIAMNPTYLHEIYTELAQLGVVTSLEAV